MLDLLEFLKNNSDTIGVGLRHSSAALDIAAKLKALTGGSKPASNTELESLVTALIAEIQDAKLANIALKEQLLEMKEAALSAEKSQSKFDRYELWQTPGKTFVYRLKEEHCNMQPAHYACPVCFEDGKISILQRYNSNEKCCRSCLKGETYYRFTAPRGEY